MATGSAIQLASRAAIAAFGAARWVRRGIPTPRRTPFTFFYLAVLAVTTIVLYAVPAHTARTLLASSSTDVYHLHNAPIRVLVSSALWLSGVNWLLYAPLFSLVIAPVERRAGSRWVLAMFASGHVIATLVTELPIAWAIRHGYLAPRDQHRLDVGVSYGFYAVLGALVGLLPRVARSLAVAAAAVVVAVPLLTSDDSLTALGHVVSLLVGLVWWPWLSGRGLVGSLSRREGDHR